MRADPYERCWRDYQFQLIMPTLRLLVMAPGLAKDRRGTGKFSMFNPSSWIYLGDLVLSNGETYIGDDVAMGGVSVGGSWWHGKSAVVHRVEPVEGEEWVLVIDWVAVQE